MKRASHRRSLTKNAVRHWHRRLALIASLFILLLTLTGVALNHAHDWGLDNKGVRHSWLLDYYGIRPPAQTLVIQPYGITDNLLWLDDRLLFEASGPLLAAGAFAGYHIAMDSARLYVLTQDGQLLDTLDAASGLNMPLTRMAAATDNGCHKLWLETGAGTVWLNEQLLAPIAGAAPANLVWLTPTVNDDETLMLNARAMHLSWERVLQDVHSGRLLGISGKWLWDLLALALLTIALTGLKLWWQQRRANSRYR
ncbi:PepSY domain-containing protein [Shewanella sp. GXUN23E]|uniref:PepSY domain-containing protein n=1 Tax=Shewanella sp. GXUN23E TaxID=3422498 RepID=UPI003D7C3CA0